MSKETIVSLIGIVLFVAAYFAIEQIPISGLKVYIALAAGWFMCALDNHLRGDV